MNPSLEPSAEKEGLAANAGFDSPNLKFKNQIFRSMAINRIFLGFQWRFFREKERSKKEESNWEIEEEQ